VQIDEDDVVGVRRLRLDQALGITVADDVAIERGDYQRERFVDARMSASKCIIICTVSRFGRPAAQRDHVKS
jgi:hypothetical protein